MTTLLGWCDPGYIVSTTWREGRDLMGECIAWSKGQIAHGD